MMPDFSKMMSMMSGGKGKGIEDSEFEWTEEAKKRVERVPAGFMRNMTIQRIESYAKDQKVTTITIDIAEAGLSQSKSMMGSMMGGGNDDTPTDPNAPDPEEVVSASSPQEQDDDIPYFSCEMCGYSFKGYAPEECPICRAAREKFLRVSGRAREGVITETSGLVMNWTDEAKERLSKTPEGFMQDMTRWRIEHWARTHGKKDITLSLVEEKYEDWNKNSQHMNTSLPWDDDALERVQRIPDFVRPMVQKEIERHTKAAGETRVTAALVAQVRDKWEMGEEFHGGAEQ